jgi:hypothetical protein
VIESVKLRMTGHVTRTEEDRSAFKILKVKPRGKRPLGRLGVDGRIILECILKK